MYLTVWLMHITNSLFQRNYFRLYFFIAAQFAQVALPMLLKSVKWAGQLVQSWQQ